MTSEKARWLRSAFFGPIAGADGELSLRPAVSDFDRSTIATLLLQRARAWKRKPERSLQDFLAELPLGEPEYLLAVVEQAAQVIGVCWVRIVARPLSGSFDSHLCEILLEPERRMAGVGTQVLTHLQRCTRRCGGKAVTLNFMAQNHRVRSLYERLGFTVVGVDLRASLVEQPEPEWEEAALLVDEARADDEVTLIERLQAAASLCSFEQPEVSAADTALRVRRALGDAEQTWLVVREGEAVACYGLLFKLGRLTRQWIAVSEAFDAGVGSHEQRAARTQALLSAALRRCRQRGATEAYVTLWGRDQDLLPQFERVGFELGRYKMSDAAQ